MIRLFMILFLSLSLSHSLAAFLDVDLGAAAAARGGRLTAETAAEQGLISNPAILAQLNSGFVYMRYQNLFSRQIDHENGVSGIGGAYAGQSWSLAVSWDHLGLAHYSEDRLRIGGALPLKSWFPFSTGLWLDFLSRRYSLEGDLTGISPDELSAFALDFGFGILSENWHGFRLGVAGSQLAASDLGTIVPQPLPRLWSAGIQWNKNLEAMGRVRLNVEIVNKEIETLYSTGMAWLLWDDVLTIRSGYSRGQMGFGLGVNWKDWNLDYTWQFSAGENSVLTHQAMGDSHFIELSLKFAGQEQEANQQPIISPEYLRLISQAQEAEKNLNLDKAEAYYKQALEMDNSDSAVLLALEQIRFRKVQLQAEQLYSKAVDFEKEGRWIEAYAFYRQAVILAPGNYTYQRVLSALEPDIQRIEANKNDMSVLEQSRLLVDKGDTEQALQNLVLLKRKYPDNMILNEMEEAWRLRLLPSPTLTPTLSPTMTPTVVTTEAYRELQNLRDEAAVYRSQGERQMEKQVLREILKKNPRDEVTTRRLNELTLRSEMVSQMDREQAEELFQNGVAAYVKGDRELAIEFWKQALQKDPEHQAALRSLTRERIQLQQEKH